MYVLSLGTMDCLQEVTNSPGRSLRSNKSSQARTRTETENRHICAVAPQLPRLFLFRQETLSPERDAASAAAAESGGVGLITHCCATA
jgi:hypothetical protein